AGLATQVQRAGFTFPYLLDTTQEVALAYHAACTPDFFLFGRDRLLAYRGAFDLSRPRTDVPVTGDLLRRAIDLVLAGQPVPAPPDAARRGEPDRAARPVLRAGQSGRSEPGRRGRFHRARAGHRPVVGLRLDQPQRIHLVGEDGPGGRRRAAHRRGRPQPDRR